MATIVAIFNVVVSFSQIPSVPSPLVHYGHMEETQILSEQFRVFDGVRQLCAGRLGEEEGGGRGHETGRTHDQIRQTRQIGALK